VTPATIKIDFKFDTVYGVFCDALHLPADHSYTDDQIAAMKQERLDNWLFAIENPPEPEMTEADDG
jgi:hypothetical protein